MNFNWQCKTSAVFHYLLPPTNHCVAFNIDELINLTSRNNLTSYYELNRSSMTNNHTGCWQSGCELYTTVNLQPWQPQSALRIHSTVLNRVKNEHLFYNKVKNKIKNRLTIGPEIQSFKLDLHKILADASLSSIICMHYFTHSLVPHSFVSSSFAQTLSKTYCKTFQYIICPTLLPTREWQQPGMLHQVKL